MKKLLFQEAVKLPLYGKKIYYNFAKFNRLRKAAWIQSLPQPTTGILKKRLGTDHEVHHGKIPGWRISRYRGIFLITASGKAGKAGAVSFILFLHYAPHPHFGRWDV